MSSKKSFMELYTTNPNDPNDPDSIRQYFMNIIKMMPNNVYWLDKNCITLGCNDNVLDFIGLEKLEDFVGINYKQMGEMAGWEPHIAMSYKKDDMEVISSGKAKINVEEPPIYDENGEPTYYLSTRVPLFDRNNEIMGVVGISIDITERKKAEIKKYKLQQCEDIVSSINNKLRNSFHSIRLLINMINEEGVNDRQKTCIQEIESLMDEVLPDLSYASDFTRLDSGKLRLQLIPSNISHAIEDNVSKSQCTSKGSSDIYIQHSTGVELIGLIEPDHFSAVLNIVIDNAIKYSHGHDVFISTSLIESTGMIIISIEDSGPGISEGVLKKLFSSEAYESSLFGKSLKLSYCKRVIEDMGGRFEIKNKIQDTGVITSIYLPLHDKVIPMEKQFEKFNIAILESDLQVFNSIACCFPFADIVQFSSIANLSKQNKHFDIVVVDERLFSDTYSYKQILRDHDNLVVFHHSNKSLQKKNGCIYIGKPILPKAHSQIIFETINQRKLLLVEDEPLTRKITKEYLESCGYDVTAVETGEMAESLDLTGFYAILMDIGLPGNNGIITANNITKKYEKKTPPIIAITGLTMSIDADDILNSGCFSRIFSKPAKMSYLVQELETINVDNL